MMIVHDNSLELERGALCAVHHLPVLIGLSEFVFKLPKRRCDYIREKLFESGLDHITPLFRFFPAGSPGVLLRLQLPIVLVYSLAQLAHVPCYRPHPFRKL